MQVKWSYQWGMSFGLLLLAPAATASVAPPGTLTYVQFSAETNILQLQSITPNQSIDESGYQASAINLAQVDSDRDATTDSDHEAGSNSVELETESAEEAIDEAESNADGSEAAPTTAPSSDDSADSEDTLRIIVTAEKRPDDVQQVPLGITVLTESELEDGQITSLQDIARNVPNFYFNPVNAGGNYFSFYSIRGVGNANFINRDAVGFYIDDVPYDYGGFLDFDLIDLAQVEVLRGPQNTLYGRSSAAGVVNIVSRPPTDELEVRAVASYGNENARDFQLSVSDTLISDQLSFRLSGSHSAHDGFFNNTFLNRTVGEVSSFNGRGRLVWTPTPAWNIALTASINGDRDGAPIVVPFGIPDPFTISQDFSGFYHADSNAQALRIAYTSPQLEATAITARRYSYQDSQLDADATEVDFYRRLATLNSTVWSQELRLQSPATAERFRWLVGGYYESNQFVGERVGFEFSPIAAAQLRLPFAGVNRTDYQIDRETYAVFGQVNYQPIEPLTLTAGLRYEASTSRLNRQRTYEVANSPLVLPSGATFNGVGRSDGELLPRLAVDYRISSNVLAYASFTRGYRPGGLNPTAEQAAVLEYQEETSWNYELGVKTTWLDNRLTANLALFTNQIEDYQVLLRGFDAFSNQIVNANARVNGVEFELRATPIEGLALTAGLGYIDAQFTDYTNPFTTENFNGNQLPYAPSYTYNLAAQYRSPGGFFGRLEVQGSGVSFFEDANRFRQDAFALVNARLGYEWDNAGVYLFANNLFDVRYMTTAFTALGQDYASFGEPRTFGVQVRARF